MRKVYVMSAFVPVEGFYQISKIPLDKAKRIISSSEEVIVASQHETVKLLGLFPAKERITVKEDDLKGALQIWIKPKERLQFGKEYSLEELEEIGYDIWLGYRLVTLLDR